MENKTNFGGLGLSEKTLRAVENAGYEKPSPIQSRAIPVILARRDLFGCAQTGTGKTAAFALPIMQMLEEGGNYPRPKQFRALILTPTRELAEQIDSNIALFGRSMDLSHCKIYGGVSQNPQVKLLANGVDILVATPGRLLDLFNQRKLEFGGVEFLVLDEADRMLDMGFINDIRKICRELPKKRQSLLFSATLSKEVEALAKNIVDNPEKISVSPDKPTVDKIAQKVAFVNLENKFDLLEHMMKARLEKSADSLALIFCRTKHGANKLAKRLCRIGIEADAIHGNKSQSARKNALERFKRRESHILVATDIAARGIDVKDMSLVVNYDLPEDPETYVHRIGRTARAEADGESVSFCTSDDAPLFKSVEKFIKKRIDVMADNPFHSEAAQNAATLKTALAAKLSGGGQKKRGAEKNYARTKGSCQKKSDGGEYYGGSVPSKKNRQQAKPDAKNAGQNAKGATKGAKPNGKRGGEKIGGMLKRKMKAAGMTSLPDRTRGGKKKASFWQKLRDSLRK